MAENPTYPRYIPKHPQGEDGFTTKPHETIAEQVARCIEDYTDEYRQDSNEDNQSKDDCNKKRTSCLIGLEGKWGSGKSNLIKILAKNKNFGLDDKFCLYTFDAWAFQEDLSREAFLFELGKNAIQKNHICTEQEKIIQTGFDKLFTKNIIKASRFKTILSFKEVLTIILLTILGLTEALSGVDVLPWWVYTVVLIVYSIATALSILIEKRTLTTESIFESSTQLCEYKAWLQAISEQIGKPIIIVFDNMDRLPKDKVEKLWSLIHTFFSEELNTTEKDKAKYPLFGIVPFDRAKLSEAMHDGCSETTSHYLDKTFSIIYPVVEPILRYWKGYFEQMYIFAFSKTDSECTTVPKKIKKGRGKTAFSPYICS